MTHNENFWRAYYEVAPGDPGIVLLHASLLLCGGEADRANYLAVAAGQRPGVPVAFRQAFETIIAHSNKLREKPKALLAEGIALHDKGDYAGAIKKYQAALELWPQYGWAWYELGQSQYHQDLIADGKKPPL